MELEEETPFVGHQAVVTQREHSEVLGYISRIEELLEKQAAKIEELERRLEAREKA